MAKNLEELCRDVLRWELKSSEVLDKISNNYSTSEVNDAMSGVVKDILENIDNPQRELRVYVLLTQIGESFDSKSMVQFGIDQIEDWKEKHTDE